MADLVSYGNANREIEQALNTLRKGAHLLKYGRKGKPKFYPFRVSNDESTLIWISSSGERTLKLASVTRIIPGQRTAVFQRYLRPEKDFLSFSLIYNNGKRSLDLICKDKVEAEVWIAGLKALISSGQDGRSKIDGWSDGAFCFDDSTNLTAKSPRESSTSATEDINSPESSVSFNPDSSPKNFQPEKSLKSEKSHESSNQTNMKVKGYSGSDAFRVSVSSATSSHGSPPDDSDALGDVYIWGEVVSDNVFKIGCDKSVNHLSMRTDVLLPTLLESNIVLDVNHISCGVRHSALVTRQGEIFTWGEESGGQLGHGVGKDVIQPRLVESLSFNSVDFAACGEFHTCAVTMAGELYTWGDGTHNAGILGHGTNFSHWIPKRISGPLEGLQVAAVTCGPWHTAVVTSTGKLFTFGDGTFGVLGHGDRENVSYPREVESLSGLRTIAVACGVWHTAAVVEVIATQSNASVMSGKLFTWGDGDKNRLGHGDKEPRLKPTCVPALIDYNVQKVACGHSLTVGLTTSGHVFTLGSTVYGQLGNPHSDGKLPSFVEDKLVGESVEEISCGAYHISVVTSRNEVYTWGKGAHGSLGHGDVEDRKTPTLVEALKDRHVKYIACGSNYTAAICLHKWVFGSEQSQCSACRQAFGFTRKRHNCNHCGLVHCHPCSSRKAMRAALAPNPSKPYRVCDSCFAKLNKVSEVGGGDNRRNAMPPRLSGENKDKLDKADISLSKLAISSNIELINQLDSKVAKQGNKSDTLSLVRFSQEPSLLSQMKDVVFPTANDQRQTVARPLLSTSGISSRSVSPFSRRSIPPRSATPVPTISGLSFSKNMADSLKKKNELLNQEVLLLRAQVESLRQRCELHEGVLQKSVKKTQEAVVLASGESAKANAANEVIKSLTAQLKHATERFPAYTPNGLDTNGVPHRDGNGERHSRSDSMISSYLGSPTSIESATINGTQGPTQSLRGPHVNDETKLYRQKKGIPISNGSDDHPNIRLPNGGNGVKSRNFGLAADSNQVEAEWIEQYEPGVYITLVALHDGTNDLKRVRFSRRRFGEHQAETWWSENREKVHERYNLRGSDMS